MNAIANNNFPAVSETGAQLHAPVPHGALFHCCCIAVFCAALALFGALLPVLPIGGLVCISLFLAVPLQLVFGYGLTMKRTILSVHWRSSGFVGRLLNNRLFMLVVSFVLAFVSSLLLCVNIATFSAYDIASVALALLILTWKHNKVVNPIVASQAVSWEAPYYAVSTSILPAIGTYVVVQLCLLYCFPQIASLPVCNSLAEALEKRNVIAGNCSLLTCLCDTAIFCKTVKEYYLARVLTDLGWEAFALGVFELFSIISFMTVYAVVFLIRCTFGATSVK